MASPAPEGVGAAIRQARESQGLTRKELVERSGLSYPYLAQIEGGDRQPSTRALVRLADALGLRASDLLAASEDKATYALQAMTTAPAAAPMQQWVPAPAAAPGRAPRTSYSRGRRNPAQQQLTELTLLAAELEPADLNLLLQLARRLAR